MLASNYTTQTLSFCKDEEMYRKEVNRLIFNNNVHIVIASVVKHNNVYVFVPSMDTSWQKFAKISTWHPDKLKNIGADGRFITGLIKHDKPWEVYIAANTGINSQEVNVFDSWDQLKVHIGEQWKKGMDVTDMVNYNEKYYIVTSSGLNWKQSWYLGSSYPEDEISKALKKGMVITEIMSIGDNYLWIFSGNTGYTQQTARQFPVNTETVKIFSDWLYNNDTKHEKRLTMLRVVGDRLFVVLLA